MKSDERDYLLKVINIQNGMIESYAQKNMNKFILLQKELEQMQKSSFKEVMEQEKDRKKQGLSRVKNLFTELESVIKTL